MSSELKNADQQRESKIFLTVVGTLAVALIGMGLLQLLNIIHV